MKSNDEKLSPSVAVILCTAPSEDEAARLARGLVESELAACVAVLPGVRSFYRWEGALEEASEFQLVIKCTHACASDVSNWLVAHHSYDVPEVLVLPITGGNDRYLRWVEANSVKPTETNESLPAEPE